MKAVTVLMAFVITTTLFANTSALLPPFAYTAAQAIMGKITEYFNVEKGKNLFETAIKESR